MIFELDGQTYFTEDEIIKRTLIRKKLESGQVVTCLLPGLPHDATKEQVNDYLASKGAKVVG